MDEALFHAGLTNPLVVLNGAINYLSRSRDRDDVLAWCILYDLYYELRDNPLHIRQINLGDRAELK